MYAYAYVCVCFVSFSRIFNTFMRAKTAIKIVVISNVNFSFIEICSFVALCVFFYTGKTKIYKKNSCSFLLLSLPIFHTHTHTYTHGHINAPHCANVNKVFTHAHTRALFLLNHLWWPSCCLHIFFVFFLERPCCPNISISFLYRF